MPKHYNDKKDKGSKFFKNPETSYGVTGKPEGDNHVDNGIALKALNRMYKSSYSIKVDPYQAANEASTQYPLTNGFNKTAGGNYYGDRNIDGGNVQQYANSTNSLFLKAFDVMRVKNNINYRLLPMSPAPKQPGLNLVDESRKSISEALSVLKSSTFTNLAINNFIVATDLPMGSATTTDVQIDGTLVPCYVDTTDVLYAMSIYYQLFLQENVSVMSWNNSFRAKEGIMLKNAFNREVPQLNDLFGLFNKSSFINLLTSINLSFEGEYIDTDWMLQVNTLSSIPSRRSNSINDPILELQIAHNHPSYFKVYVYDVSTGTVLGTVFDSTVDLVTTVKQEDESSKTYDFFSLTSELKDYLSLEATTYWARRYYKTSSTNFNHTSSEARFRKVSRMFAAMNEFLTKFKPAWADYRECLDIMKRTGTINWSKGISLQVIKNTDMVIPWNITLDHIFQLMFGGPDKLTYNTATTRLQSYALWNIYSGIPEYDAVDGGAFLAFSFKDTSTIEDEPIYGYLPVMFTPYSVTNGAKPTCAMVSRDGDEVSVTYRAITLRSSNVLARLAPLPTQIDLTCRIPTVMLADIPATADKSHVYKVLTQVFGLCSLETSDSVFDYALDPDILAVYQFEFNDITNAAITYSRYHAPFKGTSSLDGADKLLGFIVPKL